MAPLKLLSNHNEGDEIEWISYVKKCSLDDLKSLLSINTDLQEFEICAIIQKEIDFRKKSL